MPTDASEEEILPHSLFLFLKKNNGGEECYRLQSKYNRGYSLDEVEDRILDLREKEKERIIENKEGWIKLQRHHGEI